MSGTKAGGKKAAATNKERHGKDFYKHIGTRGGKAGHTGGFYANPELARLAGRKGGLTSSRAEHPKSLIERRQEAQLKIEQDFKENEIE